MALFCKDILFRCVSVKST